MAQQTLCTELLFPPLIINSELKRIVNNIFIILNMQVLIYISSWHSLLRVKRGDSRFLLLFPCPKDVSTVCYQNEACCGSYQRWGNVLRKLNTFRLVPENLTLYMTATSQRMCPNPLEEGKKNPIAHNDICIIAIWILWG